MAGNQSVALKTRQGSWEMLAEPESLGPHLWRVGRSRDLVVDRQRDRQMDKQASCCGRGVVGEHLCHAELQYFCENSDEMTRALTFSELL